MWVWSDELVERASTAGVEGFDCVPLIAYAVIPEADLDEFALEVLSATRPEPVKPRSITPGAIDR